jgi:hypothetical protein
MGYMRYHTIIVSSWDSDMLREAHDVASGLLIELSDEESGLSLLSPITGGLRNGVASFMIAPDGSKEGWAPSDAMDEFRSTYTEWLKSKAYEDGSTCLEWVEVQFADEAGVTKIVGSSERCD